MPKNIEIQTITLNDVHNIGLDVQRGKVTGIHLTYTLKDGDGKRITSTGSDHKLGDLDAGKQSGLAAIVANLVALANAKEGTA